MISQADIRDVPRNRQACNFVANPGPQAGKAERIWYAPSKTPIHPICTGVQASQHRGQHIDARNERDATQPNIIVPSNEVVFPLTLKCATSPEREKEQPRTNSGPSRQNGRALARSRFFSAAAKARSIRCRNAGMQAGDAPCTCDMMLMSASERAATQMRLGQEEKEAQSTGISEPPGG